MLRKLLNHQTYAVILMNRNEKISLLLRIAHLEDCADAYQGLATSIAEEFEHLALAVDQAGSFVATTRCRMSDFSKISRDHRQE